jgi:hypothetical protein
MSGLSWTQTELIYAYYGASTNLATFTTEDNLLKTYPLVALPLGNLFDDVGSIHSGSVKVVARGLMGYTTGSPTFTWSLRVFTTSTWSVGGVLLGSTPALAATASAVTLAPWKMEVDIGAVTAPVAGSNNMTIKAMGTVESPLGLLAPAMGTLPPSNTAVTATIDSTIPYYLFISCACSASNSLNLINTQMLKVYGEN